MFIYSDYSNSWKCTTWSSFNVSLWYLGVPMLVRIDVSWFIIKKPENLPAPRTGVPTSSWIPKGPRFVAVTYALVTYFSAWVRAATPLSSRDLTKLTSSGTRLTLVGFWEILHKSYSNPGISYTSGNEQLALLMQIRVLFPTTLGQTILLPTFTSTAIWAKWAGTTARHPIFNDVLQVEQRQMVR